MSEIAAAMQAFNDRTEAAFGVSSGNPSVAVSNRDARLVYSDLFDVSELIEHAGGYIAHCVSDVVIGKVPIPVSLMSAYMQGVALGVLLERRRQEEARNGG